MSRRLGFLAALLVWLYLAGPAAATVHRYTDSRGVIHISNIPPPQARATRGEGPALAPKHQAAPPVSVPAPSSAPAAQLLTAAQVNALLLPENSKTAPPRASTASGSWQRPLLKAASEMAGGIQASPAEILAAKAPKTEVLAGGLRRYRDAAGVWHLTNLAPAAPNSAPALMEAQNRRSPGAASASVPTARPEALAAALPWRPASYSPGTPLLASRRTTPSPARLAALEGGKHIRRYRDRQGVIHISNLEPIPPPLPLERVPATLQAGLATGPNRPISTRRPSLEDWAANSFKPASWSGEGVLLPPKRRRQADPPRDAMTAEGGIRRWRDKKGVWHIKTVEYPWPAGVPVPARLAGLIPGTRRAESPRAAAPPGGAALRAPSPAMQGAPTAYQAPLSTITAFKDRRGRLRITNARPGASSGRAPPPGVTIAPAQLEPLIVEAAQVYRLPPSLVKAVIKEESDFCVYAVSPKGAMGLMQLMPGTADFLGVREPFNPRENILGGCRYLRLLIDFFGGSVPLALAGYNAGYHRVVASGFQVPPIKETQNFVTKVMERYIATEKRLRLPWT
jgi:hypothetical protein